MARGRDTGDVAGGARGAAASGCAQGGSRDGSRAEALLRRLRRGLPAVRRDPAGGGRIALKLVARVCVPTAAPGGYTRAGCESRLVACPTVLTSELGGSVYA